MERDFIDISNYNTILSYDAIPQTSLKGVIIKATEGTTLIDDSLEKHYEGLHQKIPIGFYHFLTSTSAPETQAQNFWNQIKDKEFQILPILDVEQDSLGYKAQMYSEQFMSEFFRLSGMNMIMYSYTSYIQNNFDVSFRTAHKWWIADYSENKPTVLGCLCIAWQYTDKDNSLAFVNGDIDSSMLFNESEFFINGQLPFTDDSHNTSNVTSLNDIARLQNELIVQGFVDKNGNELIIDGIAGELTLSACPTLHKGAQGNITAWVQHEIISDIGYFITNDGIFGNDTENAVINYQNSNSLIADGIVGQATWRKLIGL